MTFPNFFFVGAAKSGTTTIHHALTQHPDIFMSEIKEPAYFSEGWPHWINTLAEYEALFDGADGYPVIGEASTPYFDDSNAPHRIARAIPTSPKILISLRNPVDRAYSNWEHATYHEGYETRPFAEAIEAAPDQPAPDDVPHYRPWMFTYFQNSLYSDKVQRYMDVFGRERVHVLLFEEMVADTESVLAQLFDFLNVPTDISLSIETKNASRQSRLRGLSDFLQSPPAILQRTYERLPVPVQQLIFKTARAIYWTNQTTRDKTPLDPALRTRLMQSFLPDIHELEIVLNRDLSLWYDAD